MAVYVCRSTYRVCVVEGRPYDQFSEARLTIYRYRHILGGYPEYTTELMAYSSNPMELLNSLPFGNCWEPVETVADATDVLDEEYEERAAAYYV